MWPLGLIGFCFQSRLKSDKENRLILQEKYYTKCANNGICWHKGDKYNVNQYFVFKKDKLFLQIIMEVDLFMLVVLGTAITAAVSSSPNLYRTVRKNGFHR